jgi:hypothetical protein
MERRTIAGAAASVRRSRVRPGRLLLAIAGLLGVAAGLAAQPAALTLRVALVPEWVVERHRGAGGVARPELRATLDGGVVDGLVFGWSRGALPREALVAKPIRVLPEAEAALLGGRGAFRPRAVRGPAGPAAWTAVEVEDGGPDGVLVVEIGGELGNIHQVLESLLIGAPDGTWLEPGLARRALFRSEGVPIVIAPVGRPLARADAAGLFRGANGIEALVVRSPIDLETTRNGGVTARGLADVAPTAARGADWRDGDRVYLRVSRATLAAGAPPVVLGWKDRITRADGGRDQWDPAE